MTRRKYPVNLPYEDIVIITDALDFYISTAETAPRRADFLHFLFAGLSGRAESLEPLNGYPDG